MPLKVGTLDRRPDRPIRMTARARGLDLKLPKDTKMKK